MPISNLAKIFGPTVVGYSQKEPDHRTILGETIIQQSVSIITCYHFQRTFFFRIHILIQAIFAPFLGHGTFLEYSNGLLVQFYQHKHFV